MKDSVKKRNGTSFKGYLLATYQDLLDVFGEPITDKDNCKVDVEWIIDTPHGIATIYNYKNGKAYLGDRGLPVEMMCEWHVGGNNIEAYQWVKKYISDQQISRMV